MKLLFPESIIRCLRWHCALTQTTNSRHAWNCYNLQPPAIVVIAEGDPCAILALGKNRCRQRKLLLSRCKREHQACNPPTRPTNTDWPFTDMKFLKANLYSRSSAWSIDTNHMFIECLPQECMNAWAPLPDEVTYKCSIITWPRYNSVHHNTEQTRCTYFSKPCRTKLALQTNMSLRYSQLQLHLCWIQEGSKSFSSSEEGALWYLLHPNQDSIKMQFQDNCWVRKHQLQKPVELQLGSFKRYAVA